MSTFAPVYRPAASQQSFLTREQKRERKRKRERTRDEDGGSDSDSDSDSGDSEEQLPQPKDDAPRVLHPVNKTDPYYVAGHPREKPLPGGNFPHAAVREFKLPDPPVEKELASLNPPLYVPKVTPEDTSQSVKRRHLDNLTAILHKCMLNGDWARASRVWGLILRTEIQGYGPDIRQNGRWMIGAELLMRRNQTLGQRQHQQRPATSSSADSDSLDQQSDAPKSTPTISDEGFQLARDYYQRLALQYPHHARAHHSVVTALAIYPALFSVWVYEVQDRATRARETLAVEGKSFEDAEINDDLSDTSERNADAQRLTKKELEDAVLIVQRLDELMLNPPYDTSSEMLNIQGMVYLWVSDLHKALAKFSSGTSSDYEEDIVPRRSRVIDVSERHHKQQAIHHREKAKTVFKKMIAETMEIPDQIHSFLQDEGEDVSLDDAG